MSRTAPYGAVASASSANTDGRRSRYRNVLSNEYSASSRFSRNLPGRTRMLPMGRPRSRRKDLPTGLHFDPKWETYFYRAGRGEKRMFVSFGKVSREKAIKEYVRLTLIIAPSQDGTVGD